MEQSPLLASRKWQCLSPKTVIMGFVFVVEVGAVAFGAIARLASLHHAWGAVGLYLQPVGVVWGGVWVGSASLLLIGTIVGTVIAHRCAHKR